MKNQSTIASVGTMMLGRWT